jgi:hypothetical protein
MTTKTRWLGLAGAVIALAVALALWLEPVDLAAGLHGPDGRNYLSLLHSLFFDQDLLLYNDNALFSQHAIVTPTGYALELHNVGTALAFLPFYAFGHLTCLLGAGSCTGEGLPYYAWLSLGNWAYGLLALVFTWRLAARHVARRWATIAVGAVALGSPFFYYGTRFFNPHMPALLLVALLAWVWDQTRGTRALRHWLLMGALVGLAASIATYNAVFLLLPGIDLLDSLRRRRAVPVREGALLALGALVGVSPQLVAWQLLFGSALGVPYQQQLFWLEPGLPDLLVSAYHGLYFYSPALLLATVGFVPLFLHDRRLALASLVTLGAHVYVSSCNIAWWGGASYGARYLLSSLPLLALPLALLLARARWRGLLYAALAACILWSYGLMLADVGRLVDPGQYIPPAWQLRTQVRVLADLRALLKDQLLTPRFVTAPWYALPGALLLAALAWLASRLQGRPRRGLVCLGLAFPLAATVLLGLSWGPGRAEVQRLETGGALDGLPRGTYDLYDLSEGYRQRGAYRFVRGDLERARADLETAREIYAPRSWVRLHVAGQRHVPNPTDWWVDGHLRLVGWEAAGEDVILYWLPEAPVLAPAYRTRIRILGPDGQAMAVWATNGADAWRSLGGEVVRAAYPLPMIAQATATRVEITVYPADGSEPLGRLELGIDADS